MSNKVYNQGGSVKLFDSYQHLQELQELCPS